jgi:hypothetical protein
MVGPGLMTHGALFQRGNDHALGHVVEVNGLSFAAGGGPAFYGAVHEFGGNHAYPIVATKARALAFMQHGRQVYAKSVMHPPARQRAFMGPTLAENAEFIRSELEATLREEMEK